MKRTDSLLPEHEELRRAAAWLAEQPSRDAQTLEEACRRFDFSSVDEDFLLHRFRDVARGERRE